MMGQMMSDLPIGPIRLAGVGRVADNKNAVLVCFSRELTDEELRLLHAGIRKVLAMTIGDLRKLEENPNG